MKKKPTIIKKGKLVYVLYQEEITVFVGLNQWLSYNKYINWNRQGISKMRDIILKSKESEYATPSDLMSLAYECKLISTTAVKPKEEELCNL